MTENFSPPDEPQPLTAREGVRCSMLIQAVVSCANDRDHGLTVRVRNLSEGGLMATSDEDEVVPGCAIRVRLRGIGWVGGTVIWREQERFGVEFDRKVDPRDSFRPVRRGDGSPRRAYG
ncbi:MAG: PilZ domain-containing protein [Sphingomonadaceae bacterium]